MNSRMVSSTVPALGRCCCIGSLNISSRIRSSTCRGSAAGAHLGHHARSCRDDRPYNFAVAKSMSDRWAIAAATAAIIGALAAFAGAVELTSGRALPSGWTRYQPPWTLPIFVSGIALLVIALALALVAVAKRGDR
jgi:hypothetical protein